MSTNPTTTPHPTTTETSGQLAIQLHQQCHTLLTELDALQTLLAQTLRNPQLVEVRQLRSNVNSELKMLAKRERQMQMQDGTVEAENDLPETAGAGWSAQAEQVEMRLMHALRSSNLPFYQAVWNIAKSSCSGLVAFGKRFYWEGKQRTTPKKKKMKKKEQGVSEGNGEKLANKDKRKSVFVDIVADDGEEWVKVSTISESRLLFEMAKKGWERDDEEDEEDRTVLRNFEGEEPEDEDEDDEDELELIRLARDLRRAADATRVRYRHPRLRIVIPKIEEGNVPEIDDVLNEIRCYDIKVECKGSLPAHTNLTPKLDHLLPQPFKRFTPTLNVDCTLLLALVSDLSHVRNMQPSVSFHKAIIRQIQVEQQQPLLSTELWPAMDTHELVCTKEAATRMREIVDTIGTETEKTRTRIMMGDPPYERCSHDSLIQQFQELSEYHVPAQWRIPIRVVEARSVIQTAKEQGKLPPVVDEVAKGLSDINFSVFVYGWAADLMTISSNRTIDKQIEATVEKNRKDNDDLEGPLVWICDTARSLVGKDKHRKA